ncbi:hypothetical protein [Nitrospira lenta]|uniref:Uncharacterized protein n=1 Tax=Nitrospira lenta TaxID=1436998 RepID=A0A330L799_9BACT|nr:hypothetical protein [Nitrospira lenta]SPP65596.1 conserved hypothetical protein [Nitrospira lenta]
MTLRAYIDFLHDIELALAESFRTVSDGHRMDGDVHYTCRGFAADCEGRAIGLGSLRVSQAAPQAPTERMALQPLVAIRKGPCGLLRDLQELHQIATLAQTTWAMVGQAAAGARNKPLQSAVAEASSAISQQAAWLVMRMKAEAPQVLLVGTAPDVQT